MFIFLLIIIVIIFLLYFLNKPKKVIEKLEISPKIVLYHLNRCIHCRRIMPEWNNFEKEIGNIIKTEKKECSSNDCNIIAFPTIILYKDNKEYIYNGDRTSEDMKQFVYSILYPKNSSK